MPAPAAERLVARLAPVRERHPEARWIAAEALHVTLVFLGSTDPGVVERVAAVVREATAGHGSFVLRTAAGGGTVRDRHPGVAWLELDRGRDEVSALASRLDAALRDAGLRGEPEGPPAGSRPHVTVARRATRELLAALRSAPDGTFAVEWRAVEVVLFRSHDGPGGSRYEPVARFPLAEAGDG